MKTPRLLLVLLVSTLFSFTAFGQNSDCLTPSGAMQQPNDPVPTCFAGYGAVNSGALTQFFTFIATTTNMAVELTPVLGTACGFPNTAINYSNFQLYSTTDCVSLLGTSPTMSGLTIGASYTFGLTMTPQDPNCVWISQSCPRVVEVTIPLGGDLLYFNGHVEDGEVQLSWAMPIGNHVKSFEIKRRISAVAPFQLINQVSPQDPTEEAFTWKDPQPVAGHIEYMLEIVDQNGIKTVSPVVGLDVALELALQIAPNPCSNYLQVRLPENATQPYCLLLTDIRGQLKGQIQGTSSELNSCLPDLVSKLRPGTYLIQCQDGKSRKTARFHKI